MSEIFNEKTGYIRMDTVRDAIIEELDLVPHFRDSLLKHLKLTDLEVIKHVVKQGSRRHVISYNTQGRHCSEENCEINKEVSTKGDNK